MKGYTTTAALSWLSADPALSRYNFPTGRRHRRQFTVKSVSRRCSLSSFPPEAQSLTHELDDGCQAEAERSEVITESLCRISIKVQTQEKQVLDKKHQITAVEVGVL